MKQIIETEGLSKYYGKKAVVQEVDLKVPEGCVYGFMGPNGAGKSTTMKMLLGLVKKSGGSVAVNGVEMNEKNRLDILKETGSLIESPSYYGHLSGRENLEIVCALKDVPQKEVDGVLKVVRMEKQQHKKVREYSLGMKQRLGLAAALLGKPKVLLLDEPTNGLDPAGIQEMRELICALPEKFGMTVFLSSHLLSEIDQMADHVGIIDKGQLIFQDTLEALHEYSQSRLLFKTSNQTIAADLLRKHKIICDPGEEGLLLPPLPDERTAWVNALLQREGIGVYRIEERQKTLEEIFLGLTGRRASL